MGDDSGVPFFPDIGAAEQELEHRVERDVKERYDGLSLYQAGTRKVKDAMDVFTDQYLIGDFLPGERMRDGSVTK